jgi:ParB family transcriptional regulator, chromosome partitioning protein
MSLIHQSESIPLNKLKPSAANVRKTGREVDIEPLAASIAAHGLLHPLTVAAEIGKDGEPTGKYGVIAGGRRFAALKLLAKRKVLPKTAPIPCIPITESGTEISLAENVTQAPMHPADQYDAFAALHADGMSAEDIGARFGLSARGVKQRLRLGAASPKLMSLYREGEISLDQLMAFCLTDDHAAQERTWDSLSYNKEPYYIRRLLTEGQVPLTDRRAAFVGIDAYEAAGGVVTRDLFSQEDGDGMLADPVLLEQLVTAKLEQMAEEVRGEGWKWVIASLEFDYRDAAGMQRVYARRRELADEEQARLDALESELERLPEDHPDMETEAARIEAEIEALTGVDLFDPQDIARGGAWVSLGYRGEARIERGFIRPEDMPVEAEDSGDAEEQDSRYAAAQVLDHPARGGVAEDDSAELPARLLSNLTAHRTAVLRHCLTEQPDIAYLAVVHAFVLQCFYWGKARQTCLEITLRGVSLPPFADNLDSNEAHRLVGEQHAQWAQQLPEEASGLWDFLINQSAEYLAALLAHGAASTLDAVHLPGEGRHGKHSHADQLAASLALNMIAYWEPTEESYFGRVTKAQIAEAVREAKGQAEAERMNGMKKADMAARAERLLKGTGWLPAPLRSHDLPIDADEQDAAIA